MKKHEYEPIIPPIDAVPFGAPMSFIPTDPEGSYTGVPESIEDIPIQDVDDL